MVDKILKSLTKGENKTRDKNIVRIFFFIQEKSKFNA